MTKHLLIWACPETSRKIFISLWVTLRSSSLIWLLSSVRSIIFTAYSFDVFLFTHRRTQLLMPLKNYKNSKVNKLSLENLSSRSTVEQNKNKEYSFAHFLCLLRVSYRKWVWGRFRSELINSKIKISTEIKHSKISGQKRISEWCFNVLSNW